MAESSPLRAIKTCPSSVSPFGVLNVMVPSPAASVVTSFFDGKTVTFAPAIGFPLWFEAAKLFYICPQEIACHSFEKDKPAEEWPALVNKYIRDSREVGQQLATRCRGAGRHFVYLDIDAHGSDFEFAHKTSEDPGAIFVFRQEAPVPGSHSAVGLPTAPRTARLHPPFRSPRRSCAAGGRR